MYGIYIYANIWGILMVNVAIYMAYIHGSYGVLLQNHVDSNVEQHVFLAKNHVVSSWRDTKTDEKSVEIKEIA